MLKKTRAAIIRKRRAAMVSKNVLVTPKITAESLGAIPKILEDRSKPICQGKICIQRLLQEGWKWNLKTGMTAEPRRISPSAPNRNCTG